MDTKGKCFYCFSNISVENTSEILPSVQHGKSSRLPHLRFLERLDTRNEFFINSHHLLRETIMALTGAARIGISTSTLPFFRSTLSMKGWSARAWISTGEWAGFLGGDTPVRYVSRVNTPALSRNNSMAPPIWDRFTSVGPDADRA